MDCQSINICVETEDDFVAIGFLQLAPDGVYYLKNDTAIGKLEDDSFKRHIEKLAGANGQSEAALFQQVCDCYAACKDIPGVAKALGLSRERVRRILITKGALTNDLIEKIAWLNANGKGKSVAEIAEMLKVSVNTVQKNMAYEERQYPLYEVKLARGRKYTGFETVGSLPELEGFYFRVLEDSACMEQIYQWDGAVYPESEIALHVNGPELRME